MIEALAIVLLGAALFAIGLLYLGDVSKWWEERGLRAMVRDFERSGYIVRSVEMKPSPQTVIEVHNEPCQCPPGRCEVGVPESSEARCINRRTGDVRTLMCERCSAYMWHQDGKCIRCYKNVGPVAA